MNISVNIPEETDEGTPIPAMSPDATDLVALLEYARIRGFRLGHSVKVGRIELVGVVDLRDDAAKQEAVPGPWEEAGLVRVQT